MYFWFLIVFLRDMNILGKLQVDLMLPLMFRSGLPHVSGRHLIYFIYFPLDHEPLHDLQMNVLMRILQYILRDHAMP